MARYREHTSRAGSRSRWDRAAEGRPSPPRSFQRLDPTGIETAFVFPPGIPPHLHDAPSVTFALDAAHVDDLTGTITIAQGTDASGAANLTVAEALSA